MVMLPMTSRYHMTS